VTTGRTVPHDVNERSHNPGPSDYNYKYSSFTSKGVAKIRELTPEKSNFTTPGPGDYDVYKSSSLNKGIYIPKAGRKGSMDETPGPGYYQINPHAVEKKKSTGVIIPKASLKD
jgi:hypothetical protein